MVDMVASFQCCRPCFFEENPMDSYDLKISHTYIYIYIFSIFNYYYCYCYYYYIVIIYIYIYICIVWGKTIRLPLFFNGVVLANRR